MFFPSVNAVVQKSVDRSDLYSGQLPGNELPGS